ncbi:MAG: hypothetical protein KGN36_09120 [Acidobacteriota bacterium]|nr:hypothetical protein [Acidobacteriota bacterium]
MTDREGAQGSPIPRTDYIYFATGSRGSFTITRDFVAANRIIVAQAYSTLGNRMPLVPGLLPGETILLAYGSGRYQPIFRCKIRPSPKPLQTQKHTLDVFCEIDPSLHDRLGRADYRVDPVAKTFVGITIDTPEDLQHLDERIIKPKGNNTLRRWDEVFKTRKAISESAATPRSDRRPEVSLPTPSLSSLTASTLAEARRTILRLLDRLEKDGHAGDESVAARINHLSRTEVIPRTVAACMRTVTEMRNATEYGGRDLSPAETKAVIGAWEAISEWVMTCGLSLPPLLQLGRFPYQK